MDVSTLCIIGITAFTIMLFLTLALLFYHSGLLVDIKVEAGAPPIKNFTGVYKFGRGSYKDAGPLFTEVVSISPGSRAFGVYYDDPQQVETENLRWIVGCIVSEGSEEPDKEILSAFMENDYKQFSFPEVNHAVRTSFPHTSQLSVLIGIYRVYPQLSAFVQENKLCAHPWIEIYDKDVIHYVAPLAKQDEFYVPEAESEFSGLVEPAPDSSLSDNSLHSNSSEINNDVNNVSQTNSLTDTSGGDNQTVNISDDTITNKNSLLEQLVDSADSANSAGSDRELKRTAQSEEQCDGGEAGGLQAFTDNTSEIRQRKVQCPSESAKLQDAEENFIQSNS